MIMHSNNTKIFLHTACISLFVSETPSVKKIYIFPLGMVLPLKKIVVSKNLPGIKKSFVQVKKVLVYLKKITRGKHALEYTLFAPQLCIIQVYREANLSVLIHL